MRRPAATLALLILALLQGVSSHAQMSGAQLSGDELIERLRRGGMIVFFRHAQTDQYPEQPGVDLNDCTRQRNLNELGRYQAGELARAFQGLGIRIDRVVNSPACRCRDTAILAFGKSEPSPEVLGGAELAALQSRLSTAPAPGFNDVIVGHSDMGGVIGDRHLDYAESVIVQPLGVGRWQTLLHVPFPWWPQALTRKRDLGR
jgi:hypothetical protein